MAKRRMFSTEIVRSDAFLDLPVSSRELYFQLGMDTDDRGYIPNAKSIIRVIGANIGDLEPLINKGFLMLRGDTLILQKHFRINNTIRSDRFKESEYIDDLKKLFIKSNGVYTDDELKGKPAALVLGIPTGNQTDTNWLPQFNLSKDKLSKVNLIKENDINRYNEIKANGFAGELFFRLVECEYVSVYDLDTDQYIKFFKELLDQYEVVDIKIKLLYFIKVTCHYLPIGEDKQGKKIFGYVYKEENQIGNKFVYFQTTINNAFSPKEYLSPEEQEELQRITNEYQGGDTDTNEDDDDSLPF